MLGTERKDVNSPLGTMEKAARLLKLGESQTG